MQSASEKTTAGNFVLIICYLCPPGGVSGLPIDKRLAAKFIAAISYTNQNTCPLAAES
jgi:hypothetical protein